VTDFLADPRNLPLLLGLVFAWLAYRTSPESRYETVEGEQVSTRQAFLAIALVLGGLWLALRFWL
jgi:hypothetical protein